MNVSFNWLIVLLSILVAIYVSYIVVGICIRIAVSNKTTALYWTIGGALSMATGIWAMHFIGMLAFSLPVPVHYDIALTVISILPAICASAIALYMIRAHRRKSNIIIAAVLMGLGIAAMHYIGMAAMGMGSCIEYSTSIVILSIVIAIAASTIALFLLFHQIDSNRLDHGFKLLSALIMGGAITSMHYIGMFAATFAPNCESNPVFGISLERDVLVIVVTMASFFILTITQMLIVIDRKISEKSFFESVFKAQSSVGKGLLVFENDKILLINQALKSLFLFKSESENELDINMLEKSFEPKEYQRFYDWVHKAKSRKGKIDTNEFTVIESLGGRILSTALVEFIHVNRVRHLIVTDDITEKKQSEQALNHLNESLEKRVHERTNDLTEANELLHDSMNSLKETQSELVQSQKMASLGSLVAGISHEINTPIGIGVTLSSSIEEEILLFVQKYESGAMKKSDLESFMSHVKKASEILSQNLKRASELISSFKQVAVDQTGDTSREIRLFDYMEEIITSMRPKLKKTGITVENHIHKDIVIFTKPGAVYQIVNNLITNSLIHGFNHNDSGVISLSSEIQNDKLKLIYADTGKGIDESIISRIFDPFFTTRLGEGGSGLGLNIVYNLITSTLKGKVDVISKVNHGVRFEILLPMNEGEVKDV
jgi:NO-binding membrane sensor protein with MHYT domain/signal transduction histidine kinase